MPRSRLLVPLALLPLPLHAGVQSALHPHSEDAGRVAEITWVLFTGGAIIFVLVGILLAFALGGPMRMRVLLRRPVLIVAGGIIFPVVVLTALLIYTLTAESTMLKADTPPAARIEVVGEMWWWRVRYLDSEGLALFETANDIRMPAGVPVELVLKSDNVIHSFWVPNLAGKLDMVPGHVNRLRIQAQEPGLFRGQCAEYCGAQHAKMMFDVKVLSADGFQSWVASQREPAHEPADASLALGKQVFMQHCVQCHTIRGTVATGTSGPDLTHVGSRLSLAAGVLPNNVGAMAGWIAGSQHIKPGNAMPSFNQLSGENLRAVAKYMESLQ
ncbi:c-type cytochrome [Alcaligenaceae bacterium]|nr:c-type cytochrome [Alcaligenaceae bacterium]